MFRDRREKEVVFGERIERGETFGILCPGLLGSLMWWERKVSEVSTGWDGEREREKKSERELVSGL